MKIYGTLICQNGIAEIARCIESVAPMVDEYFIMDGGSTDGTWEWLQKWKDVYHLTLFQNPYRDQGEQRNLLLSHIPQNTWVVNIDQDEQLGLSLQFGLKDFIHHIDPQIYTDTKRELPLTISVKNINLVQDLQHYNANNVSVFATKIFYNDRNLRFSLGYHMSIHYETEHSNTNTIIAPDDWIIKHYAYLDPDRIASSAHDKKRKYSTQEWDPKSWNIQLIPSTWI